jgi:hypothetical protein
MTTIVDPSEPDALLRFCCCCFLLRGCVVALFFFFLAASAGKRVLTTTRTPSTLAGRFEAKGFKLAAMRLIWPSKEKAAGHYDDLKAKKFFGGLVDYFASGPVCAMSWEGKGAIKTGRVMVSCCCCCMMF